MPEIYPSAIIEALVMLLAIVSADKIKLKIPMVSKNGVDAML